MIRIDDADLVVFGPVGDLAAIVDEETGRAGEGIGRAVQVRLDEENEGRWPEGILAAMRERIGAVGPATGREKRPRPGDDVGMLRIERRGEDAETRRLELRRLIGEQQMLKMKQEAAIEAIATLPRTVLLAQDYLTEALDVGNTIATKMNDLSRVEYEELLRPAFRQDEWKLIAVGAAIGFLVGELQVHLLVR